MEDSLFPENTNRFFLYFIFEVAEMGLIIIVISVK